MNIIEIDSSSEGEDDGIAENGQGSLVLNVDIVDRHVSVLDHGEGACMTVQRRALPPSLQPPPPKGRGPTLSAKPTNGSAAANLTSMVKDPTNDRQILPDEDRDGKGMPNTVQRRALPPSLQPPPSRTVVAPHGGGPTLNAQSHTKPAAANLTSKVKDYIGILKRKRKLQSEDEDPMDYNVKRNQVVGTYGSHPPSRTVPNTAAGGAHGSQYPPVKKEKLVNINVPKSSNGTIDERRPLYPLVKKEKLVTTDVTIASYGNKDEHWPQYSPVKKDKFITTGVTMASNGSQDDIHISRNAGTHRVLPPSLMNGTSASSSSPLAGAGDAGNGSGLVDERLIQQEERIIYQEALQNLGQTKLEDDPPEGLLSVTLLKHQKIALAWMVQREASCHCAGGILADDQGLGKTISMIALIQKQRTPLSESISDGSCQIKTEALNLDEDDETIEIDKECEIGDVKREQVTGTSIHTSGKRRTPPLKFTSDGSCQLNTEVLNLDEDDATIEIDKECEIGDVTREQVASTLIHTSSKWKPSAGTLVVCPASILRQWARELDEKVTSSGKLSVLMYHGGARTRDPGELAKYNVVLTTYSIVSKEVPKKDDDDNDEQRNFDKYGISSEWYTRLKRKKAPALTKGRKKEKGSKDSILDHDSGPLARVRWFRIILDEAQIIKNHRTQIARACSWLRAKRRWCLSGTPIQNSIDDLYSYLRFLKYTPYADYVSFYNLIKKPMERDSVNGYRKLQALLRVFLLRRTKGTLIDGEPVVKLPPKTIVLKKVDFSPEERSFYLKLESDSRQKFKAYAAAGTVKQNYANILLMLLRLRQACDHPVLVRDHRPDTVGKDSLQIARQVPRDMLISLLNQLEASMAICRTCNDPPEDAVVTMCHHVFCFQCVSERLTGEDNVCPAAGCKNILNRDSVFSRSTLKSCISDELNDNNASTSVLACDEESSVVQSYVSSKIKAVLEILNSLGSPSYVNSSEECKVKDCCQVDTNLRSCTCSHFRPKPEIPVKTIIFSQWNAMLDLLEVPLKRSLIQYRRLDGTMSLNSRDRAVKEFNNDLEVTVMLMSLKAGNLGLNMIAACHVILVDLWWNPTTEDQAVDRAHRIGQTRPVTVSRLTIKDSVEDRILALQEEKRKMVASAFGEDQSGSQATRLTEQDLRFLFKI